MTRWYRCHNKIFNTNRDKPIDFKTFTFMMQQCSELLGNKQLGAEKHF